MMIMVPSNRNGLTAPQVVNWINNIKLTRKKLKPNP